MNKNGGIVLLDAESKKVLRSIGFQYDPTTINRTLQSQRVDSQGGDRSEALRLTGPPIETISVEIELEGFDLLDNPAQNNMAPEKGILPVLTALEMIVYPSANSIQQNYRAAKAGVLEISPVQAPLTVFVWNRARSTPVRIDEMSIEEQFFDDDLNPVRAKVSLSMRVLNTNDLGFQHHGGNMYMVHQRSLEQLAARGSGEIVKSLAHQGFGI